MIYIGLEPEIAKIGPFSIGWHGIFMLVGIVAGVALTWLLAKRLGISAETTCTAAIWAVVCGLIGARLTHVLDDLNWYVDHPARILALHEGGLGWYGGLIGGILGVVIYSRIKRFSLARFADAAAPGVILGLSIGRIGCTINGDAYGTPTDLPWGFIYTNPDSALPFDYLGTPTHPAAVYEILLNILILMVMWRLWRRLSPDGSLFLVSLVMYSVGRFAISWARGEDDVLGPLHQSHIISLIIFAVAAGLLVYRKTRLIRPDHGGGSPPSGAQPPDGQIEENTEGSTV